MMACRTLADTHSLTTTVAMMISRISDTCVHDSVVIAALSGNPMPPAPTRPSTVDSRMFGPKSFAGFGSYTVDSVNSTVTTQFNGCSNTKVVGLVQERKIVLLTADQLKYINPVTTADTSAEVLWKRLA